MSLRPSLVAALLCTLAAAAPAGAATESDAARAGRGCASDPIFASGFESDGFDDWVNVQALDRDVSLVRGGSFCGARHARFELRRGDVEPETGSSRAEVTGPRFHEGDELWFRQATKIRRGFPQEGKFQIVSQWKSGDGSPPVAVFVTDGPRLAIKSGDFPTTRFWSAPIRTGSWYDLVTHVKFSRRPSAGFVEVWLNGRRRRTANGRKRAYGRTIKGSWGYVKLGYYRDRTHRGTGVVLHDNYLIGRSLADVAPRR
jgi:Polysaccharide lyase